MNSLEHTQMPQFIMASTNSKLWHDFCPPLVQPRYQGPFSTTESSEVATTFCDNKGLMFMLRGSFNNALILLLGIDMKEISGFKEEQEILLHGQVLPIQKTTAFQQDDAAMVDHLVFSVKSTETAITEAASFYKKIGIKYDDKWLPLIGKHPALLQVTEFKSTFLIQRLFEELSMNIMAFPSSTLCRYLIIRLKIKETEIFDKIAFYNEIGVHPQAGWSVHFDQAREVIDVTNFKGKLVADRLVDELEMTDLAYLIPLFIRSNQKALPFDGDKGLCGEIEFHSKSDVVIAENVILNANAVGLCVKAESIVYRMFQQQKSDKSYSVSSKETNEEKHDANRSHNEIFVACGAHSGVGDLEDGCGGGTIVLLSHRNITNRGLLTCNGTPGGSYNGGTVFIWCSGNFVNEGRIECKPDGKIFIQCQNFVNKGTIDSQVQLYCFQNMVQPNVRVLRLPWSGGYVLEDLERVPLSYHSHRGHELHQKLKQEGISIGMYLAHVKDEFDPDYYHPRNLLDQNGTKTGYASQIPADGDWNIFKIESSQRFVPRGVVVRNYNYYSGNFIMDGIRTIELHLATKCDAVQSANGSDFQPFAIINRVNNGSSNDQYYGFDEVMMTNAMIWMADFKFIKLIIRRNWGGEPGGAMRHHNALHSFAVLI